MENVKDPYFGVSKMMCRGKITGESCYPYLRKDEVEVEVLRMDILAGWPPYFSGSCRAQFDWVRGKCG